MKFKKGHKSTEQLNVSSNPKSCCLPTVNAERLPVESTQSFPLDWLIFLTSVEVTFEHFLPADAAFSALQRLSSLLLRVIWKGQVYSGGPRDQSLLQVQILRAQNST